MGFPGGSVGTESACNVGDLGSVPGLGRSPGRGHGNPLQYSCLENPHGQRSLVSYSPWGHKEQDTAPALQADSLLYAFRNLKRTNKNQSLLYVGWAQGFKKKSNIRHLPFTCFFLTFFKNVGHLLKPLMTLLQYCFGFMLLAFWPRGPWALTSSTRDETHTPCIVKQKSLACFLNAFFVVVNFFALLILFSMAAGCGRLGKMELCRRELGISALEVGAICIGIPNTLF